MLDLAQSRLAWARDQIFQYWNPDWKIQSTSRGAGTAERLPSQQLVVMDGRWWRWNVAFALLPAFLIGTYCEFRGQYLMYKYHQEQELRNLRRLMGDDFVEKHRDALIRPPPENFLTRSWNAFAELLELLRGRSDVSDFPSDSVPGTDSPTSSTTSSQSASEKLSLSGSSSPSQASASSTSKTTPKMEPVDVEQLASRLQKLEELLVRQVQHRQANDGEQMQQSGIQNRMEATFIESWKRAVSNTRDNDSTEAEKDPNQSSSSLASSLITRMSRILDEAVQMVLSSSNVPDMTTQKAESTCEREEATNSTAVVLEKKADSTSISCATGDARSSITPQSSQGKSWWSWFS
jgi:hypothetical protein